jgi:hypothetical protein
LTVGRWQGGSSQGSVHDALAVNRLDNGQRSTVNEIAPQRATRPFALLGLVHRQPSTVNQSAN